MPRLRLAPLCCHARSQVAVAELGVVRRCYHIVRTTLLSFLSSALLMCAARAVSIGEDDAWSFSDAVVIGSVQSVSQVRLLQEIGRAHV